MANRRVWIGADPGGAGKFGVAVLCARGTVVTCRVDCADEAVGWVRANVDGDIGGAGVDAPLWWSSGPSGGRRVDQWLRDRYRLPGGEVQQVNSLRGAALVQAAMFVERLRSHFPQVPVTEAHPKALLKTYSDGDWFRFTQSFSLNSGELPEDERDAVIAAVCAREGFEGRWTHDLSKKRLDSEQDPAKYWLAPVHYYWPEH